MNGLAMYATTTDNAQEGLVNRYAPLVKRIAYHLISRLPPSVQAEDLIQAGMIGLLEAARNYDPSQGASFETYAGIRIRGSMLDEIRKTDWTPRSVHRKARMVAEVVRKIENTNGRDARDKEVAEAMDISLQEYHQILMDATGCRLFSFDDLEGAGDEPEDGIGEGGSSPVDFLQQQDFKRALAESIATLPERERLVMALYYDEELNLREIGEVLGVSESRVCQIHGQALLRLRGRMGSWLSDQQ
ncbi:MAG: RNA polymerase sigma factor FliA [Chromatiales bacterium 21-64-14]|nr:MAG: RNA polymerase sigma factor FliA [Chromatiales bacterium 21-64-14]HQU15069.1 RNA polymerase sigma factor FliA [Gammaproteobacteria bacterium]